MSVMKILFSDFMLGIQKFCCSDANNKKIQEDLQLSGFSVLPNKMSAQNIIKMKSDILQQMQTSDNVVDFDSGSDRRIFGICKQSEAIKKVVHSEELLKLARLNQNWGVSNVVGMANVLKPNLGNLGSGGGWHRDTRYSNQFKAFIFLTDVTEENGPLTYIRGSHTYDSIRLLNEYPGLENNRFRFSDKDVQMAAKELKLDIVNLCVPAGTICVANTRGIHRGAPITSGTRIALTNYYFSGAVPDFASNK